ncbi:hypothetical protein DL769_001957 [Monosporascus sp. CRB-8-3]|nr:hypothetical protein DL769_001957 [Monosporascus sp. CRB-8-3]
MSTPVMDPTSSTPKRSPLSDAWPNTAPAKSPPRFPEPSQSMKDRLFQLPFDGIEEEWQALIDKKAQHIRRRPLRVQFKPVAKDCRRIIHSQVFGRSGLSLQGTADFIEEALLDIWKTHAKKLIQESKDTMGLDIVQQARTKAQRVKMSALQEVEKSYPSYLPRMGDRVLGLSHGKLLTSLLSTWDQISWAYPPQRNRTTRILHSPINATLWTALSIIKEELLAVEHAKTEFYSQVGPAQLQAQRRGGPKKGQLKSSSVNDLGDLNSTGITEGNVGGVVDHVAGEAVLSHEEAGQMTLIPQGERLVNERLYIEENQPPASGMTYALSRIKHLPTLLATYHAIAHRLTEKLEELDGIKEKEGNIRGGFAELQKVLSYINFGDDATVSSQEATPSNE